MRTILIDKDDSFTWNLAHHIETLGSECIVVPSASTTLEAVLLRQPDRIVLSPGPGGPASAQLFLDVLRAEACRCIPTLGVCLGHQCIAHVFGGATYVRKASLPVHGETSDVFHTGQSIFAGLSSPFTAARYHSLVVPRIPPGCRALAWTGSQRKRDLIMGMRHRERPLVGIQFHPESFLTPSGALIMQNFLAGAL